MTESYKKIFIEDIKLIKEKKLEELLTLKDIKNDVFLLKEGIYFDDNHTCFYGFDDVNSMAICLNFATKTYGIFLDEEFIGITSYCYHYPLDLTRNEICICLDKNYRSLGIGSICMSKMIDECFTNKNTKSIHLSIREDNTPSIKVAKKLGFKEYIGYKKDSIYEDLNGKTYQNKQYLLKKKANY